MPRTLALARQRKRRLAARGRLAVLVDRWGRKIRKIGRLETRAETTRCAISGGHDSLLGKLSLLLEQIAQERGREREVISRIIHIEDRHRFQRATGGLRRAVSPAYGLRPLGGMAGFDDPEGDSLAAREEEEARERRRRARSWLWAMLAWMAVFGTGSPAVRRVPPQNRLAA